MDCLPWLRNILYIDVWEIRKHKLYDSDSGSGLQLHTQSSPGERSGKFSQNGKFGQKGKVHLGPNVSSSAHDRGQWQWCYGSNMSIIIIIIIAAFVVYCVYRIPGSSLVIESIDYNYYYASRLWSFN